jgi:hypothetical protein
MLRGSSRGSSRRSSSTTSPTPRVRVPRHVARLVIDYFDYAARPGASARRAARHAARRRLLYLRRASGCFGTSRGLSCDSSSTTPPRSGSSSTTSPTPRVRVPRHIARLVTRLTVDYFASRRLAVDYFAYVARPGASARRAARRAARHRLLHLRRASGCLGTSRGSSRSSSSTTPPTPRVQVPQHMAWLVTRLVVDYFTYAARPVASARHAACRVTHRRNFASRRLVVDYFAYAACLGASAHRAARHVARRRLLRYAARPGASERRAARLAARRRLLRLRCASGWLGTSRGSLRGSSSTTPCAATSSCGHTGSTSATPCVATTCLVATLALLRVRRAPP